MAKMLCSILNVPGLRLGYLALVMTYSSSDGNDPGAEVGCLAGAIADGNMLDAGSVEWWYAGSIGLREMVQERSEREKSQQDITGSVVRENQKEGSGKSHLANVRLVCSFIFGRLECEAI
jgi:hypothetical protein